MLQPEFDPFPVLSTQRLLLRKIELSDAAQILQMRSNPAIMQYISRPLMHTEAEAIALIELILQELQQNNGITWAIALKEKPEMLIGTIGFWRIIKAHFRAEIGYMLMPEYGGKGLATEAIKESIQYAFGQMGLHSIEANIDPTNKASEAVLRKCGFVQEAYFKENFFFDGRFLDSAIFSLVNNA